MFKVFLSCDDEDHIDRSLNSSCSVGLASVLQDPDSEAGSLETEVSEIQRQH